MPAQIAEQFAPQVARHGDKDMRGDASTHAPRKIVRRDQADQQRERQPLRAGMAASKAEHVDQMLDCVLRSQRTADCGEHTDQHRQMGEGVPFDVTKQECEGAVRIFREPGIVCIALRDSQRLEVIVGVRTFGHKVE